MCSEVGGIQNCTIIFFSTGFKLIQLSSSHALKVRFDCCFIFVHNCKINIKNWQFHLVRNSIMNPLTLPRYRSKPLNELNINDVSCSFILAVRIRSFVRSFVKQNIITVQEKVLCQFCQIFGLKFFSD